jgi:hypothetical protein
MTKNNFMKKKPNSGKYFVEEKKNVFEFFVPKSG